ncbi:MAG: fused MFS/spermidine synthase [Candidatus Omnitrophota bacterium]
MSKEFSTKNLKIALVIAYMTSFIASASIMAVELTASRLIATFMGSSLYTWTAVIGVILGGISLGNYLGGSLADRFNTQRLLSILFIIASLSAVLIPTVNSLIGRFVIPFQVSWPVRITFHVSLTFFIPSMILGMIAPSVAKFALDQGLKAGHTIGNIYAFGALGSIFGTFLTGFFLVSILGSKNLIYLVAIVLLLVGLFYSIRYSTFRKRSLVTIIALMLSVGVSVEAFGLSSANYSGTIYSGDSQYFNIRVESLRTTTDARSLVLDNLSHSKVFMKDPSNIFAKEQYDYIKFYGALTNYLAKSRNNFSALCIGGGAYVFPQYLKKHWSNSYVEAVEIDPAVTEVAKEYLGFSKDSGVNISHLDARNYVDGKLRMIETGHKVKIFDFIYSDTCNAFSAPFQLTTTEFNEKIKTLLAEDGAYVFNLVDSFSSGRFLGAMINTLEKTFSNVYVFCAGNIRYDNAGWNTFILVASDKEIDFSGFVTGHFISYKLKDEEIALLKNKSKGLVLKDDFAPTENLLKSVALKSGLRIECGRLMDVGNSYLSKDNFTRALDFYRKAVRINPEYPEGYSNIASVYARLGDMKDAEVEYKNALNINPDLPEANYGLGNIMLLKSQVEKAKIYFTKALEGDPEYAEAYFGLANIYKEDGLFEKAIDYYAKALNIDDNFIEAYNNLGEALIKEGRTEGAIECFKEALRLRPEYREAKENLNRYAVNILNEELKDSNTQTIREER